MTFDDSADNNILDYTGINVSNPDTRLDLSLEKTRNDILSIGGKIEEVADTNQFKTSNSTPLISYGYQGCSALILKNNKSKYLLSHFRPTLPEEREMYNTTLEKMIKDEGFYNSKSSAIIVGGAEPELLYYTCCEFGIKILGYYSDMFQDYRTDESIKDIIIVPEKKKVIINNNFENYIFMGNPISEEIRKKKSLELIF